MEVDTAENLNRPNQLAYLNGSRSLLERRMRVVVVGDTVVSEQGLATLVGRNDECEVCAAAHTFHEANRLIGQARADLLLIEPFMPDCDGIRWIKELATKHPDTEILVVSRQSEQTY